MNRRGFLRLGLSAMAGAAVAPLLPAVAELIVEQTASGPVPVVFGEKRVHVPHTHLYSFDPVSGVYTFLNECAGHEVTITCDYPVSFRFREKKAKQTAPWTRPKRSDKVRHYS